MTSCRPTQPHSRRKPDALNHLGAGYQNTTLPGPDGIYGTSDDTGTTVVWQDGTVHTTFGNLATPTKASNSSSTIPNLPQSLFIPNIAPDNGLSAPFNSFFTIFGQFFDHGLALISKSDTDFVSIPLMPDDPSHHGCLGPRRTAGREDTDQVTPFIDRRMPRIVARLLRSWPRRTAQRRSGNRRNRRCPHHSGDLGQSQGQRRQDPRHQA